jgi:hypothetical protein
MKNSSKMDQLIRTNKGKQMQQEYVRSFSNFEILKHVSLKESDSILGDLTFQEVQNESLDYNGSVGDSRLLNEILNACDDDDLAYIFDDRFIYCGVFVCHLKPALKRSLDTSLKLDGRTLFFLDVERQFFIRVNNFDKEHSDFPETFEIQVSKKVKTQPGARLT